MCILLNILNLSSFMGTRLLLGLPPHEQHGAFAPICFRVCQPARGLDGEHGRSDGLLGSRHGWQELYSEELAQ